MLFINFIIDVKSKTWYKSSQVLRLTIRDSVSLSIDIISFIFKKSSTNLVSNLFA